MTKDEQKDKLIEEFLTGAPVFDPDEIDLAKAERAVLSQIGSEHSAFRRAVILFQRTAAILIIPLLILTAYLALKDNGAPEPEPEAWQELSAPYGTLTQVNLPDGTKVWLNGGSSLRHPVCFRKGERTVSLVGEGFFEVTADKSNPFTVETAQMRLTATGTKFNIEAWQTDSVTSITMIEGRVSANFDNAAPIAMTAGQRLSFNRNTRKGHLAEVDPYKWYAWKDGLMVFRDDPLSYVFKRLEQTFNVNINVKNPEIATDLYRATFEDESLDEILRLLEHTAPIRFVYHEREKNSENLYLKKQIDVYQRIK